MSASPTKLYAFTYGEDGTMYDPAWPTFRVRARSLREARAKARRKLAAILRHAGRAHWEWHSDSPSWRRVPRREVKGHLIGDGRVVDHPAKARRLWRERVQRANRAPWPKALGGSRETFASFISWPILQPIESAPALADLFKGSLHESKGPSIPTVHTSYSRSRPTKPPVLLSRSV